MIAALYYIVLANADGWHVAYQSPRGDYVSVALCITEAIAQREADKRNAPHHAAELAQIVRDLAPPGRRTARYFEADVWA